eukprot:4044846-Amphidinium_carterae.3
MTRRTSMAALATSVRRRNTAVCPPIAMKPKSSTRLEAITLGSAAVTACRTSRRMRLMNPVAREHPGMIVPATRERVQHAKVGVGGGICVRHPRLLSARLLRKPCVGQHKGQHIPVLVLGPLRHVWYGSAASSHRNVHQPRHVHWCVPHSAKPACPHCDTCPIARSTRFPLVDDVHQRVQEVVWEEAPHHWRPLVNAATFALGVGAYGLAQLCHSDGRESARSELGLCGLRCLRTRMLVPDASPIGLNLSEAQAARLRGFPFSAAALEAQVRQLRVALAALARHSAAARVWTASSSTEAHGRLPVFT